MTGGFFPSAFFGGGESKMSVPASWRPVRFPLQARAPLSPAPFLSPVVADAGTGEACGNRVSAIGCRCHWWGRTNHSCRSFATPMGLGGRNIRLIHKGFERGA